MNAIALIQAIVSGLLALTSVIGAFLITFYYVTNGKEVKLPDFVALLIGGVIGSYLTHVASVNGARQAGTAAAQTAVEQFAGSPAVSEHVAGTTPSP